MTTVADLAARVQELRRELNHVAGIVHAHGDQIGNLPELRTMVLELVDAVEAGALAPQAIYWAGLDDTERARMLDSLAEWVTDTLARDYPEYTRGAVRACWRAHPEAVIELSILWCLWRQIYSAKYPPLKLAAEWHDRWMPNALTRLAAAMKNCAAGCAVEKRRGIQAAG